MMTVTACAAAGFRHVYRFQLQQYSDVNWFVFFASSGVVRACLIMDVANTPVPIMDGDKSKIMKM